MTDATDKAQRTSIFGAVAGAIAASACCIGPLVLGLLGIGGTGALAIFAGWRPYLLAGSAALLGLGFWLTYRRRASPASGHAGDACGCPKPRAGRTGRVSLWIATALVAAFAASPYLIPLATRTHPHASATAAVTTEIAVDGMDCASCAVPVRQAVERVGGAVRVDVDVETGRVVVRHIEQPGLAARYVDAIHRLGYGARLAGG